MKLVVAFVLFSIGLFASAEDGLIDIDEISATASVVGEASTSGGSDGDDEDSSTMVSDQSSGVSGSGESTTSVATTPEASTTTDNINIDVRVIKDKQTTADPKPTTESPPEGIPSKKTTNEEEKSSEESTDNTNTDDGMAAMANASPEEEKTLRVLTTEVIAAVVVGAVCAVLLIAFLVYRLRKRDEGSYPLSDSSYKDTYKLRGDGKEAFV